MNVSPAMSFGNLPLSVRIALGLIGGGGGAALTHSLFGATGMVVFLCGIVGVGVLLLLYAFVLRLIQHRRSASFAESVQNQSAQSPSALSKAEQIAKLDDLRSKFEEGVNVFRRAGKDFYSIPWYLLIGESGSGKTEAMRRSGVGFPAGVQDYLQGVGGTINMHWWFTNHAVVLDLAGRVVFGEVASGAGSEWETFLQLLKKQRPSCPINGMLLVIPAKSLIRDPAEEMVRKAQRIAEQINRVQRMLDVRFPVFVMVTMCDLVTGFREFFEPLHGGDEQQQMLGWSNVQPIDEAFHTEMTEQYLATVVSRLLRRRQLMLRDPSPQRDLSDSRLDEVDALFKLPDGFGQLAATLKLYLQTIFVPTEWAARPPFLRGIYFTSSMQEGAALDVELAKALGLPLDKLPEDGIWKRERALFLRDLFLDKVFQEKGLVTSASNVRQQYRRRKIALLGVAAAAAVLLLSLTWLGWRTLDARIGQERDLWRSVADEFRSSPKAMAVVASRSDAPGAFDYWGARPQPMADGRSCTLAERHAQLFQIVQKPLNVPRIFHLTFRRSAGFDVQRLKALRIVFENGILKPAIDCARAKMLSDEGPWAPEATAALAALIRIQADLSGLTYEPKDQLPRPADLDSLFRYVLTKEDYERYAGRDRQVFDAELAWCYNQKAGGKAWPPVWLPRHAMLASDPALKRGVERFIDHGVRSAGDLEPQIDRIKRLLRDMLAVSADFEQRCRTSETALVSTLVDNREELFSVSGFESDKPTAKQWERKLNEFSNTVSSAFVVLEGFRQRRAEIDLCKGDNIVSNYLNSLAMASKYASAEFAGLTLPRESSAGTNVTLVADIKLLMDAAIKGMTLKPDADKILALKEFEALDLRFSKTVSAFAERVPRYQFPAVPPALYAPHGTWKERWQNLRTLSVIPVHRALEQFCGRLSDLCKNCQQASNDVAVVKVLGSLSAAAQEGLSSIGSRAFKDDPEKSIECWRKLDENATLARNSLRPLEADRFCRDFFVERSGVAEDYVVQYWQDLTLGALTSLADEVEPEVARLWKELKGLTRFPLDLDAAKGAPLSVEEFARARGLLRSLDTELGVAVKRQGRTIGEGARCGQKGIDDQLNRLCNPNAEGLLVWVDAARKVFEALPDGNANGSYDLSLVSAQQQKKLMEESGLAERDSACNVFENYYVAATQKAHDRKRIGEPGDLTTVTLPGPPFDLYLYPYGETTPLPAKVSPGSTPWAVLEFMLQKSAKRAPDDPLKWYVPFVLSEEGNHKIVLWLQIKTDKAVPARAEWPKNPPE